MMIAAVNRVDRKIVTQRGGTSGVGGFDAMLTAQGAPTEPVAVDARTAATAVVAAFDLHYSNVEHSQADYEAYFAEGARNVSAAQGLPEGRYDFAAMTPRELRIVSGHLVGSGAIKFGDVAHLTIQLMNTDGTMPADTPTDWFSVVDTQIATARTRHEEGSIPYLQSATDAFQRFQTKSDRPAGAKSIGPSVAAQANTKLAAALEAFRKEGKMTPAERMRRQVMKEMKLTEDDLKAMPPEQRDAIEKKIGEEVALRLKKLGIDGGGAGTRSVEEFIAAQG